MPEIKKVFSKEKSKNKNNLRKSTTQSNKKEEGGKKTTKQTRSRRRKPANATPKSPVKIIPLGGLNEIGKNITAYEYENDIFLVDCGMAFPDEDMYGVDLVLPDFSYLEANREKIRGIVLTHGHEDHIGGLPYLLKKINMPVYAPKLTLALAELKLKEHGLLEKTTTTVVKAGSVITLGKFKVEFIRVNHSIPDSCALAIHTPNGVIIQTGDFKIDYTPIQGEIIDLARFGELGNKGVLALLSDSTNAERPGATPSEKIVGDSFAKLFKLAGKRRIIIATFSSNIHRIQQIMDAAHQNGRKVIVSGRSMENVVQIALELGYLKVPENLLVGLDCLNQYPIDKMVIITTGSQGEPMSALTRMARNDHRQVSVTPNDFIIISANPIPGNEKLVDKVINDLMRLGAEVIYEKMYEVHVSGHACQDELKLMIGLTKPKFFIPVHGEYKHLKKHGKLAIDVGVKEKNVIIPEIGKVIETNGKEMKVTGTVSAGKVLVDGLGVGDVGNVVLKDRKILSQDGLIIVVATIDREGRYVVAGPDIVSRGFVYVRESEEIINHAKELVVTVLEQCTENNTLEWGIIKQKIKDALGDYLYDVTKRKPMILPIIQEI